MTHTPFATTPDATLALPMQSGLAQDLFGEVSAPGDKSISHRALIFGAMAEGDTQITGLLEGADILSTLDAMKAFGATIEKNIRGHWVVTGVGQSGFRAPDHPVDCGNAGTGVRLIMGAASGYPIKATFTGDASLSSRPMARVLTPLEDMGIEYTATNGDRLPIRIHSRGGLRPIEFTPPHASAQVKSCILLAAVNTAGQTSVHEPTLTRDHTENMLEAFGVKLGRHKVGDGQVVKLRGPVRLKATDVNVPGDPSSAAFPIVAALITPGSDIVIKNVMMNPTRTGLFETLIEMGGFLRADNFKKSGGEMIADLRVKYSVLNGVTVPPSRAPSMIDEYPILAVAAAFAKGTTVMNGIGELRVKESDRISATVAMLERNGVSVLEREDGISVRHSASASQTIFGGGCVETHHDHRIAMSAMILGLRAENPVLIDDSSMIATSFPQFFDMMRGLGANIFPAATKRPA